MRRTSGRPASATSRGIATPVSSSSAPMAGFCTKTLKTGVARSGKTSRCRSLSQTAPRPAAARTSAKASQGRTKEVADDTFDHGSLPGMLLMMMMLAAAFRLLGLGPQQEGTVHDHRRAGLSPETIAISPPRSRPRSTGRASNTPGPRGRKTPQRSSIRWSAAAGTATTCPGGIRGGSRAVADIPGCSVPSGFGRTIRTGTVRDWASPPGPPRRPGRASCWPGRAAKVISAVEPSGSGPRRARAPAPPARGGTGPRCGTAARRDRRSRPGPRCAPAPCPRSGRRE